MTGETMELIRQAEARATAANVHDVKSIVGTVRTAVWAMEEPHIQGNPVRLAFAEAMSAASHSRLFDFVRHGDCKRAMADNPLPQTPPDDAWGEDE